MNYGRNLDLPSTAKIVDNEVLNDVFTTKSRDDDDGTFYFETDYLALKGNPDYLKLMKCLVVLQAQRTKILQDVDHLEELKAKAETDPEGMKEFILKGDASFLLRLNVEKVPEIDWSKYKSYESRDKGAKRNVPARAAVAAVQKESDSTDSNEPIKVRGRAYHEKKPETFNQLWTVEEQLRLEALLEEYPPEPIVNRRWRKIAAALGNRTTKQVCSRVQKYFKKLRKAGITTPGMPKSNRAAFVHRRHKHLLYKPTTFFPGVAMGELSAESSDEESTSVSGQRLDDLSHWQDILKKIEENKRKGSASTGELVIKHEGYKCKLCNEDPIIGFRWECRDCESFSSCTACMEQIPKQTPPSHPLTHHFTLFEESLAMPDFCWALKTGNYLDPSFAH